MSERSRIGQTILRHEQVDSTNTLAQDYAERGEPEGLVVTAEEQLSGRGRMGRKWVVPRATSLQLSILLRPPLEPRHASRLVPMAGLALARALEREYNVRPALKWPNDVLLDGKKVAGILAESSIRGDTLVYVVLGVGVNVNYTMRAFPEFAPFATTLQDVLGHAVERSSLERVLLAELDSYYARICRGESLLEEYRARLEMLGQPIRVTSHGEILEGIARDIDADGALILDVGDTQVKLVAGDVTILKGN
jgi:BirA family biotin operon repressor/biotin-[acetyl-CoA-carboxylase] ligase